jgi:signal transduction histidine kinase
MTRLLSILTLWVPAYDIDGLAKGFLALISVGVTTAMLLMRPRLLVLPTRIQLQHAYAALEEEVRQRRSAEAMVKRFQEIEATESQVRQAQKMEAIGQLTGGVAHDFNNILTVITGTIEILGKAVKDRPHLAQITNMMGADLTRHLLAFARRQPLQPRSVDVNALVIEAARLLRPTLGEQIEIESMLARFRTGPDRSEPALDRDPEPRPECAGRHAERRQADLGNQECRARRGRHEQRG